MIDLSRARALELTVEAEVESRFLDAMGHMNVAWYVHLFDRGIWTFFGRHGLNEQYLQQAKRGMFALEENLRYLSELREGDALDVHTGVREVIAAHIDLESRRSAAFVADVLAQLAAAPHTTAAPGPMSDASAQQF